MHLEALKKLWVSCHLLYPNSSQARDIFSILIEDENLDNLKPAVDGAEIDYNEESYHKLLKKLFKLYKKNLTVKSGSQFYEFVNASLSNWKKALQRCNQEELFVIILVFIFKMRYEHVKAVMNIPVEKVRHVFNQAIKKSIPNPAAKFELKKEIKLKEYNSHEVSHLYINEHFVEFVLGFSDEQVVKRISEKMQHTRRYDDFRNGILSFRDEVIGLTVGEHFEEVVQIVAASKHYQIFKKIDQKNYKIGGSVIVIAIAVSVLLIIRPSVLTKNSLFERSGKKITLEEVEIHKQQVNQNEMTKNDITKVPSNVSATMVANEKSEANPIVTQSNIKIDKPVSSPITAPVKKETQKELDTGVYRGVITVTDFEQVSDIIKEKIVSSGGKKAGEVELGWIKNKNISYFHFILPANQKEELVKFINQYGNFDYKFENHPRKLQAGQIRFILEIRKGSNK